MSGNPSSRPPVDVIIPVKDDAGRLETCLAALANQDYTGPFRVIVIDNGSSTPSCGEVALHGGALLLHEQAAGSYAARNTGLRASSAEVLAFTDADCIPRTGWLSGLVEVLQSSPARTIVAGGIRVYARNADTPSLAEAWDVVRGLPQHRYAADGWGATANLAVWRAAFDEVGAFNPALRSGGDQEWCRRALASGWRVTFTAQAVVDHPARSTVGELLRKVRRVHAGAVDREASGGAPAPRLAGVLVALRPPLGAWRAAGRGFVAPTLRARTAFVVAESLMRVATVVVVMGHRFRAVRGRRSQALDRRRRS